MDKLLATAEAIKADLWRECKLRVKVAVDDYGTVSLDVPKRITYEGAVEAMLVKCGWKRVEADFRHGGWASTRRMTKDGAEVAVSGWIKSVGIYIKKGGA